MCFYVIQPTGCNIINKLSSVQFRIIVNFREYPPQIFAYIATYVSCSLEKATEREVRTGVVERTCRDVIRHNIVGNASSVRR